MDVFEYCYEDLSTKQPFRDAEQHCVEDTVAFREIVDGYSARKPRILKLRTRNFDVYFGVGTDPSFIECFNWNTGQAKYPVPRQLIAKCKPPTFTNSFETATPPTSVLWPFDDVWKIVTHVMCHDELPLEYKWDLTPDWDAEINT